MYAKRLVEDVEAQVLNGLLDVPHISQLLLQWLMMKVELLSDFSEGTADTLSSGVCPDK